MSSYLAASWFASRATVVVMRDLLAKSQVWLGGRESQRTLWSFVAEMLDHDILQRLWVYAGDDERRAVLGNALARRADRESWSLTRPPVASAE